jgi:hypothetical protein
MATVNALVIIVAVATPLLAFAGALVGHIWTRTTAKELDHWRHREETMRLLRWAVELALDPDPRRGSAGVRALAALLDSQLLQDEDVELVASVASAVAMPPEDTTLDTGVR